VSSKPPGLAQRLKSPASVSRAGREEILSPLAASIAAAVLAWTVIAVYGPSLSFGFVLDDHRFVGDPRVQSSGHVWEYFTSYVWSQFAGGPASFYRPAFALWMRINFVLNGTSPWGWHLLSIVKHLSVAVLLGLLVWSLLRDRVAALIAATLFVLHPAQTESVAWTTVPDPLMSAAVLGSLLLYLKYESAYAGQVSAGGQFDVRRPHKKSRKVRSQSTVPSRALWIAASAAACLAALMTKETAVVVPAIIFTVCLITPANSFARESAELENVGSRVATAFRETLPFLGVSLVYLVLRVNALGGRISPLTQHIPWSTVLLSWPATLWFYVKVLLWPVRPRAFADTNLADTFTLRGVLLPGLAVCCAVVVLVGGCVWAGKVARRDLPGREAAGVVRALLLGALLVVLPILPALNLNALNPGDYLHGRYTYLSLAGLMLLAATGWHLAGWRLAKKWRIVLLLAAGLVAVAFGIFTIQQESMWKDDLTVFTVAHQCAPNNAPVAQSLARANVQVALDLDEAGRCDEAMPIFDQATQQYPQDWFAWAGRAECLVKLNNLPGAEQSLHRAFELSHEPRVAEQWQQVRAMMGLPPAPIR
jgi:hypothetical protein